jgi:hypothetical protein
MERNIGYPAGMVEAVQVRVGWAQVELLSADTQEVQIASAGDERAVREMIIRHENGKLSIEQPQYGLLPHLESKWLEICVRVPLRWHGNIALTTVSGAISIKSVQGEEISVDTVSGTVHVDRVRCDSLSMNAVSGAMQAMQVAGASLRVRNVSSSIELLGAAFDSAKIIAVSGQVSLDFQRPFATLDLQAATGDTRVRLPGGRAEVNFRSVAGKLSAEGFVGGEGAPAVQATTVTGNLRLTQAEGAAGGKESGGDQ